MYSMQIKHDYFEWLYRLVCEGRYTRDHSFRKLLSALHDTEFTYIIRSDADRAGDGISLRYRFALQCETDDYAYVTDCLDGPCSVLEMMVALAIRCEETIMADPRYGDRTSQWFWKMVVNLGLGSMMDDRFDEYYVEETIDIFLNREYEADGRGGLFTVKHCNYDVSTLDIWTQLCYFLDTMIQQK